jgi:hypothetical protein
MPYSRDPVSVELNSWARRLLDRAYDRPGQWVAARLANPNPGQVRALRSQGIDPSGPDNKSGAGRVNARTRWGRGAVRALYYNHVWLSDAPGLPANGARGSAQQPVRTCR